MKILTLKWDCFGYSHIRKAFRLAGFDLCELDFPTKEESTKNSEKLANMVVKSILDNIDAGETLFSFVLFVFNSLLKLLLLKLGKFKSILLFI